jgi:hypothetical protein
MMLHIVLHFVVPAILVGLFFRASWKSAYLIMVATMLVDVDHIIANPIYDSARCSIDFHPLHKLFYIALFFIPKTRLVGLGLSVHMALDSIDCQVTSGVWVN